MRAMVALLVLGALAACGSEQAETAKGSSFGQVLPGSASDAMLPYDTASSAPPLAPPTYESGDEAPVRRSGGGSADPVADEVAPEAEAT
jgi:hypothetical protein